MFYCNGSGMFIQQHERMIMQSICPYCRGRGKSINDADKCDKCHGNGIVKKDTEIKVPIKKGTKSGDNYLSNEGNFIPSGKQGKILFEFIVKNDETFKVSETNNNNLEMTCEVNLVDSLVGASVNIKHINNNQIDILNQIILFHFLFNFLG